MLDGHIHIEWQNYDLGLINNMIAIALAHGVDELNILDHTHKFREFDFLYTTLKDQHSISWYQSKVSRQMPLQKYIDFIKLVKSQKWPIKLNFGLEVCYFKEHEQQLRDLLESLKPFKFDFLIGSAHFTDGMCVDLCKEIFEETDVDVFYQHYFVVLKDIIHSQMFDIVAHPDLIKKFGFFPSFPLTPYYEELAQELKKYQQKTENNSGMIRFGFPYPGLAPELLAIFKRYDVKFCKSSDAHTYQDIGRAFDQMEENL